MTLMWGEFKNNFKEWTIQKKAKHGVNKITKGEKRNLKTD